MKIMLPMCLGALVPFLVILIWTIARLPKLKESLRASGHWPVKSRSKVQFRPEYKELLICTMDGREFVLEFTWGTYQVFFPTKSTWEASAPDWAQHQWERVRDDLTAWCHEQKFPLEIEDHAYVSFD